MKKILISILVFVGLVVAVIMGYIYAQPEQATAFAVSFEREHAGLTKHQLTLANGQTYVYLEGGQGEPLLLLHGFGGSKDNFVRMAGKLTERYHVIIPDHIGFGESSKPLNADYRVNAQVVRLHELLSRLNIQKIHIGGNSMGGHIALAYASQFPAQTASLWLLNAGGIWKTAPRAEVFETYHRTGRHPLWVHTPEDYVRVFDIVMSKPPFVPTPILHEMAKISIANERLEMQILPVLSQDSIETRIKGLMVPSLIVWGDEDRVIHPKTAEVLHQLLPASRVIMMQGIGHLPMLEDPAQTAKDYMAFRQSLSR